MENKGKKASNDTQTNTLNGLEKVTATAKTINNEVVGTVENIAKDIVESSKEVTAVATKSVKEAAKKVREGHESKAFSFFAVAVGVGDTELDKLRQISVREPLQLKGMSFREMFVWLSQSQRSVSQSNPGQEDQVKLAAPGWGQI